MSEGTVVVLRVDSEALRGNSLGDPTTRNVHVYLPPGHDPKKPVPALLALAGFTGTGASMFNADPLGEDLRSRLDRLIGSGECPPVVVAAPDCFTRVGGNQYLNSQGTGRYEDFLLDEVLPAIEARHAVTAWGVFGKSSGGYGALTLGMRRPDRLQAVACHSGDSNFELCYAPDVAPALDAFRAAGGPAAWLEKFWADHNRHRRQYHKALNVYAMARHYSPNAESPDGCDLPFDLETGEIRSDVWARWRAHDPVNLIERYAKNLEKLRLLYLDCGTRDEFGLQWGLRAMAQKLRRFGVPARVEEFDDGHMSISYRQDTSLPALAKALAR